MAEALMLQNTIGYLINRLLLLLIRRLLRARDLLDEGTLQWDRGKICLMFAPRTRRDILAIPLTNLDTRDNLVWMENKSQQFSVRTAYQVALRLKQQPEAEHSSARLDGAIWKQLWSLNIPPKIRNFVWRACSNILPTKDNLMKRKIRVEPLCEFCNQQTESVFHILWECPFARNVWALANSRIKKCSNTAADFFLLYRYMVDKLNVQKFEVWSVIGWALECSKQIIPF